MNGVIWVVELRAAADDWRPFKMYCDKKKAERKLHRLKQFQGELSRRSGVRCMSSSSWRLSCYARHPVCKAK